MRWLDAELYIHSGSSVYEVPLCGSIRKLANSCLKNLISFSRDAFPFERLMQQ